MKSDTVFCAPMKFSIYLKYDDNSLITVMPYLFSSTVRGTESHIHLNLQA